MSNIIVGRTRARSQAIQVLFQAEVQGVDVFDLLEGGDYVLDDGPLDKYAAQLARGVAVNRLRIDRLVGGVRSIGNLSRMPLVDRCVMSIAVYELFREEAVPSSVAISRAPSELPRGLRHRRLLVVRERHPGTRLPPVRGQPGPGPAAARAPR